MLLMYKKKWCGVRMGNEDLKKLGLWLATKRPQAWQRGKNDCCTLFMEYHDHMHGTDTLSELYGKYHDLKTAIKFASEFPKVDEWFPQHGYEKVESPQDGDIIMVKNNRYFPSSYIVCMGEAWGIMDEAHRMSRHPLDIPTQEYSIWRYKHGS